MPTTFFQSQISSANPLPVAVIGCGRMGRLHARVYSQMPGVKLVGVFDAVSDAATSTAQQYNCRAFANLDDLLSLVSAVTIAVPTVHHLSMAELCLKRHIACLIEKPLAKDSIEATRIVELSKVHNTPVQVGHIERFNPAIRAIARLGIKPKFIEVIRVSPMTFRSLDVGVVLDMMIHDIDIVLQLASSPVARIDAVGVSALGEVEDICNARLTFENGCVANITASRLALKTERKLRVFSPEGYISIDYQKKQGVVVPSAGIVSAIKEAVETIKTKQANDIAALNYTNLVQVEDLPIDDVEPLRAELDSFVQAVVGKERPVVNAEDGLAAVVTAEKIVKAMPRQSLGKN